MPGACVSAFPKANTNTDRETQINTTTFIQREPDRPYGWFLSLSSDLSWKEEEEEEEEPVSEKLLLLVSTQNKIVNDYISQVEIPLGKVLIFIYI